MMNRVRGAVWAYICAGCPKLLLCPAIVTLLRQSVFLVLPVCGWR